MKGLVKTKNQYNMQGKGPFLFCDIPVSLKTTLFCLYFKYQNEETRDLFKLHLQTLNTYT